MNASELLQKYKEGRCTAEEQALLEHWYLQYRSQTPAASETAIDETITSIHAYLDQHIQQQHHKKKYTWYYVAASVLILICFSSLWYLHTDTAPSKVDTATILSKVVGQKQAFLTLDNGKRLSLHANQSALVTRDGELHMGQQADSGTLVYQSFQERDKSIEHAFHTLTTPKGATFAIQLADGTKVWLNAGSSLRYPLHFANNRIVELQGEAYFEVAQTATSPFQVMVKCSGKAPFLVDVLGTAFNVQAYADEGWVKTTLVNGKIQTGLQTTTNRLQVKPGQQVVLQNEQQFLREVNLDQELAWKTGSFAFDNTDIRQVMLQLSRWYDVPIYYSGTPHQETFTGYVSRDIPLGDALAMLEKGGGITFTLSESGIQVHFLSQP